MRGNTGPHGMGRQKRRATEWTGGGTPGEDEESEREIHETRRVRTRRGGTPDRRATGAAGVAQQQQEAGPHEQQQQGMKTAGMQTATPRTAGEGSARDARGAGRRTAHERERATREREVLEDGNMRGNSGTHGRKRNRGSGDGSAEAGVGEDEPGAVRDARRTRAQRAHGANRAMEVEAVATPESMRGTSKVGPEMHMREDEHEIECVACGEDEPTGSSATARRETAAHDGEDVGEAPAAATTHGGDTAPQPTSLEAGVNMNSGRPKRQNRGQPSYDEKNRRKVARTSGTQRNKTRIRYVDDGGGRGRVPLAQTVVVGQVCIQRIERAGRDRQDAGRPPGEPG